MNIKKFNGSIPASFEYEYTDANGEQRKETINIKVKRLSFKESVSEEFREAYEKIQEQPEKIADLLVKVIADWDLYEDDEHTVKYAISTENLLASPIDFVGALAETAMGKLSQASNTNPNNSESI